MINSKKLQNLFDKSQEACVAYVKGYNDRISRKELKALKKAANEAINSYNLELSRAVYKEWAKSGDVVKTALTLNFVPGAKKASFKENKEDIMAYTMNDDKEYFINLPEIQHTCGAEVFADTSWFLMVEKLVWLIAGRLNEEIAGSPEFKYEIDEASAAFEFPEGINPLTDDGIIHALQKIFDAILFVPGEDGQNTIQTTTKYDVDGRPYCPQWKVIRESMTRAGKPNEVIFCNTTTMTRYIANAMWGILTGNAPNTLTVA